MCFIIVFFSKELLSKRFPDGVYRIRLEESDKYLVEDEDPMDRGLFVEDEEVSHTVCVMLDSNSKCKSITPPE